MALKSDLPDAELISLLITGDKAAFTEIYNRYAKNLVGFASSKLFDLEDARDIIHDLFVKLWKDRATLVITGSLRSYLFTAVRYGVVDKIRRKVTRQDYALALQSLAEQYDHSIEQHLAAKELQQAIEKALAELTPRTKQIYQLSRNEYYPIEEIAQMLGLSEQTVKNQLTTALKHLRQSIPCTTALLVYWLMK
jgi:RNA polymerase sigma-70 factor (ECF subfamily)